MKPVLLNKISIYNLALEILLKLGIKKMLAIWVWKSRVAGTSKEASDVDLWIQLPKEYAGEAEEFERQLGKLQLSSLDYTKWKYPVLMYKSEDKQIALSFGDDRWGLPLDIHIGCGLPPKGPYMKLFNASKDS